MPEFRGERPAVRRFDRDAPVLTVSGGLLGHRSVGQTGEPAGVAIDVAPWVPTKAKRGEFSVRGQVVRASGPEGEDAPFAGHALQLADAAILEHEARANDQVLDRARHEDLASARERRDAGADVHR
jgi:hypothetical protein